MGNIVCSFLCENTAWSPRCKNILITGASAGIGKYLALQYAKSGSNVALVARREMTELVEECQAAGPGKIRAFQCDLTIGSEITTTLQKAIQEFGTFDVVILNAGRCHGNLFEEITDLNQVDYMLKLNVNGVIHCCHHLLPAVPKTRASRIVVMSSAAGIVHLPYHTIYCSSKFALRGFTDSLRIELRDRYNGKSPSVCLINFPEIAGTELNNTRMDVGATSTSYQYDERKAIPLERACAGLLSQIAKGTREWGQPLLVILARPFLSIIPRIGDYIILTMMKKNNVCKLRL